MVGLHTNLESQVLNKNGEPIEGLFAAGEVAGFGGGGYHGYNSLEGDIPRADVFSPAVKPDNLPANELFQLDLNCSFVETYQYD